MNFCKQNGNMCNFLLSMLICVFFFADYDYMSQFYHAFDFVPVYYCQDFDP